ncbi:hypothetical protein I3843_04G105800 [Carya illinoinensis]|uniref:Uncharacterized protein n=1 Tax=Carya illinoinensis TaxID=32201 RepID=A0A8T1QUH2_CARIL|nr:hypothetical protein CIPAW_04G115000 [Carya illinoinensis]KAG6657785.1 hypothetical protein CIPAW_04G115000 [Carya illinoinensis]KAG6717688.1 hypothetical protein I3842_04G113400 [Carya illinoinensis]KAG7983421.1 hypothetical protein I3843_04G105800 [Carya illinoinensis]
MLVGNSTQTLHTFHSDQLGMNHVTDQYCHGRVRKLGCDGARRQEDMCHAWWLRNIWPAFNKAVGKIIRWL